MPEAGGLLNCLRYYLQTVGAYHQARGCIERALGIDEAVYGPDHPTVATTVNNLGGVLQDLGDLKGARKCFERALTILLRVCGEEHWKTQGVLRRLQALEGE